MSAPVFCWRKGAITVEALPGDKSYLFRFHVDETEIPGEALSNCVVASEDGMEAEVKAWGGKRGPTSADKSAIKEFCLLKQFHAAFWWRYRKGRPPKQVWLYQKIAY